MTWRQAATPPLARTQGDINGHLDCKAIGAEGTTMARTITLEIGKATFTGMTVKGAREQAMAHLARLHDGDSWEPLIVQAPDPETHQPIVLVGWRDDTGCWSCAVLHDYRIGGWTCADWTRRKCHGAMRTHLAQLVYRGPDTDAACLALLDPSERTDFLRWARSVDQLAAERAGSVEV